MKNLYCILFAFSTSLMIAQTDEQERKAILDSLYIEEVENKTEKLKLLHAEPLYIDLIRDLGARKGEKEWNVGFGIKDKNKYDEYEALVEYEWAPIDRLGLEIELPFAFYYKNEDVQAPSSRLESLKLAAQYTFLVHEKSKTSLAIGYLHEFEITPFRNYKTSRFFTGNVYNPFFVAAKRWGNNFHTLIYTGPQFIQERSHGWETVWQVNTNFHYMIPGTRNFIGLEINKEIYHNDFDMVLRPQMRLAISEKTLVGIVTGIPVQRENNRFSTFLRLIYEPGH